eukprot:TRINITY_DN29602_c0_g1_i3.p1 TRINITY_DN29602_c0_g1~~TRINITY_DN29602_c0_g1_i3.p1  ORF type:complete len:226 (-),score=61.41 TRINITY_DN29602_c0_g1_i3:73-750(-)
MGVVVVFLFFFFKQKTAYEMQRGLVGSEMCIRDRYQRRVHGEPCIFAHFATDNINDKSLLECLKSPFFTEIRSHQPHTDNLLRPCMIIDNPTVLRNAVKRNNARPTHEGASVVINELAPQLDAYSKAAAEYLDPIWERDWQKQIKDMETRQMSYGDGMDRMEYRMGKDKFEERLEKLRKNDPEFANLLEDLAKLAEEDYGKVKDCLLYTSPSPRDLSTSRMPSSA